MITANQLYTAFGCPIARATKWAPHLNVAINKFEINTPLRVAHFLAQVGHESGRLLYCAEIASGAAYEGRKDLGNTEVGDGVRFKGRGLIQITGRANYQEISDALGYDFVRAPEFLEIPENAAMSAGWYWSTRKLNALADLDRLIAITRKVNGGQNGINDRRAILQSAKRALGI
jgi:putative chitinase